MMNNTYSLLSQLTFRFIKYFFLGVIGLSIAFALSMGIGALEFANQIFLIIFGLIRIIGTILLCLIAITIIFESLR